MSDLYNLSKEIFLFSANILTYLGSVYLYIVYSKILHMILLEQSHYLLVSKKYDNIN